MNRRREIRVKTNLICKFWDNKNNIYHGKIWNLSKRGLKLVTKMGKFPTRVKHIELSFHIPISNADLTVKAEIRWQKRTDVKFETGLEFKKIRKDQQIDISQYIDPMIYGIL